MATKSNVRTKISAPLVRFVLVTRKEDDRRVVSASMTSSAGFVSAYFFRKKKQSLKNLKRFIIFFDVDQVGSLLQLRRNGTYIHMCARKNNIDVKNDVV
jgi:hypothetical protein